MLSCCAEARTEITPGGMQGLLSSGRKSAPPGFGVWRRRRTIIAAMAALLLLPIEVSDAGWLSDVFKGSSKPDKSPKHVTSPKRVKLAKAAVPPTPHGVKLADPGPVG